MYNPTFFDYLSRDLFVTAAKKDEDFVLLEGVLKKGAWKTMPNGIHVFIIDGKIEAGPEGTIGKSPDELNWDEISEQEKNSFSEGVRTEISDKYKPAFIEISSIKRKDVRNAEIDKVWRKMISDDTFHCVFLNVHDKKSPVLEELSKAFADYGKFPIHGEVKDQVIFYKDRIALLTELAHALPEQSRKDIKEQIDNISLQLDILKNKSGYKEESPKNDSVNVHTPPSSSRFFPNNIMKILNPNSSSSGTTQQNQHPGKPGPGGQNIPAKNIPAKNVPPQKPNKTPTPKQQTVKPNSKKPRAKTRDMLNIEFLLRKTFQFIVRSVALYVLRGTKKSNHFENKILYKVTKHILSNTNVNERDNFFDVFSKTFGTP